MSDDHHLVDTTGLRAGYAYIPNADVDRCGEVSYLVAVVDQALRQLIDVVLNTAKVGKEKVADHQHRVLHRY